MVEAAGDSWPAHVAGSHCNPETHHIRGIGNIRERVRTWKSARLRVAIATNDNRAGTVAELRLLGIDDLVDVIVSADDARLACKPAPDGMLDVAQTLGVAANRLAMGYSN